MFCDDNVLGIGNNFYLIHREIRNIAYPARVSQVVTQNCDPKRQFS